MKFQAFLALVAVLGLFCVAAVAQKDYDLDKHPLVLFKEWLDDNPNIRFANVEEEDKRFEIFSANVKKVKELNAKFAPKTRFMINKFAHLTEEEFAQMYLQEMPESMKFKVGDNVLPEVGVERLRDLPEEFDWYVTVDFNYMALAPVLTMWSLMWPRAHAIFGHQPTMLTIIISAHFNNF